MLNELRKIVRLVDRIFFGGKLRAWWVRLREERKLRLREERKLRSLEAKREAEERNLRSLEAKREAQIILNYSRPSNSLLDSLCDHYGSDKGGSLGGNPYPWLSHSYTDFLSLLFEPSREQIDLVFECGIGSNDVSIASNMGSSGVPGASLRVWRDFFPNAEIVGADIDEKVLFSEARITTYAVDQTDQESVQDMWKKVGRFGFQLMIDDGLHTFQAGRNLFLESVDRLASNGTYIIEDVNHSDMVCYMNFFEALDFRVNFVSLRRPSHNGCDVPLGDNQLVVIRRTQTN